MGLPHAQLWRLCFAIPFILFTFRRTFLVPGSLAFESLNRPAEPGGKASSSSSRVCHDEHSGSPALPLR